MREATKRRHDAVEKLAMFRALTAGELPRASMVSFLRGLAAVHAVAETALSPRVDDLLATLEAAGAAGLPDVPRTVDAALAWIDAVLLESDNGAALLGTHYVLEGSQLGGMVLRDHVAGALGVTPDRVTYFRDDRAALDRR